MAILEVEHIQKSFGSTDVLKDISFSMERGQVLSIIGSSGSGKTTLLRCLNFLETAQSGVIRVDGVPLFDSGSNRKFTDEEIRKNRLHFGLVFQNFNLFPQYTVLENVMLAPKLLKTAPVSQIEQKAKALIAQVGLSNRMDSYPCQLSGGQQQRVAIARALATDPEIIYFDEPTSALDPELTGEVLGVMRNLAEEGMTMLVVTHELGFARNVSSKVIFIENGVVVEEGPSAQVFENPRQERTGAFLRTILQHEKE